MTTDGVGAIPYDRRMLTARQLNRTAVARQHLDMRVDVPLDEMVQRVFVMQSQEPASPYVAMANRISGFDPLVMDAMWQSGELIKSTQLRVTLHGVHQLDYPAVQQMMERRLRSRMNEKRFRAAGYTPETVEAVLPPLLEYLEEPRSVPEIKAFLSAELGEPAENELWWIIKSFAPVRHATSDAPWSFGPRLSFVAAPVGSNPSDPDDALAACFLRYLRAFGPASRADFGQFTLLTQAMIKPMVEQLGDQLVEYEDPDGNVLYDVADGEIVDDIELRPRLMAMWDSVLLAYADRSRIIPEEIRKTVIRTNGDVLPTLLVDGHVAGVWQVVDGVVEAKALTPISEAKWELLADEVAALQPLFDRDPNLYSRYHRWWPRIDGLDSRVLV